MNQTDGIQLDAAIGATYGVIVTWLLISAVALVAMLVLVFVIGGVVMQWEIRAESIYGD